ncbi:MAG: hypothetical protein IVW36_11595 [Dehalococcoidia bacterium]|nr:hypothetical protein [Dehalococcoidia bacterium]
MLLLSAPPAAVPAALVVLFALGTAAGFALVHRAIAVRPPACAHGDGASAAVRARLALDEVSAADARDFYPQVEAVLRSYLADRFALPATRSGPEIERALVRAGATRSAGRLTAHLLERCVSMKTGGMLPADDRSAADLRLAREIIDLTA